jgi:sugar lactone lactonase YvrE
MKTAKLHSSSVAVVLCFLAGILLFLPLSASALTVTYVDPGYTASAFHTLAYDSRAIEFDSSGNLYSADIANDFTGVNTIYKLDDASGFATSSVYASYATTACCMTGFHFLSSGNLLISNSMTGGDAGVIDLVQAGTLALSTFKDIPDFRPTGISADTAGDVYVTGRLSSDLSFGNIYKINSGDGSIAILVNNFVGRGIAVDALGNIFASNTTDNSIWRFASGTLDPSLVASFDSTPGELTFDEFGNLYALGSGSVAGTTDISRLSSSAVPEPGTLMLLGSGMAGLVAFRKRFEF